MLTLALTLLACAPLQESAGDPQALLTELIAKTNALAGFRARYAMHGGTQREGTIDLRYDAPGRLVIVNERADGSRSSIGITEGQLWMDSTNSAAGPMTGSVDLKDVGGSFEETFALLGDLFPRPAGQVDVNVRFDWGVNERTDKTEFDLQLSYVRTGTSRLLGWLSTMQRVEGSLTIADGQLVSESERVHAEVDLETGFLARIDLTGADGSTRDLVLESLELEGPFGDELFARSDMPEDARDISKELRAQLLTAPVVRNESLLHIDTLLRLEQRAWDEQFRLDLRRFLEALHRPVLAANMEKWNRGVLQGIDEFAVELSDRLAAGGERSECVTAVAERRATLVDSLAQTREKILAGLASGPRNDLASAHWNDVRALEDQVLGELYDAGTVVPMLATFDSKTSAALGT